jgi:ParB family transcriptional regulator, chromosome partitioning protein
MTSGISRRALGRGLTKLIPLDSEEKGSDNEVVLVDADSIRPNPFQPRREFKDDELAGLAESIKNQGLLQAIILRKKQDGYEIISGERRFRALKILGQDKVPSIVKPKVSDREMMEMALVENIQREDLSDMEQAKAFQRLLQECGLSHEDLAVRVGKSRSAISNTLRLLKLPNSIQQFLANGEITSGHARALLSIEDPEHMMEMAEKIISQKMNVRDIEDSVQKLKVNKQAKPISAKSKAASSRDPDLSAVLEKMQYRLGTQVRIAGKTDEKGKIEIYFFSRDDLSRIIELLSGE